MRTRGCTQLFLLIALLFGARPALPSTLAPGGVTFNNDVAPIIFAHCASCHRPGQIAPFSLLTYEDVKARADRIAVVAAQRLMPPWKPEFGKGEFLGQRRLIIAPQLIIKKQVQKQQILQQLPLHPLQKPKILKR